MIGANSGFAPITAEEPPGEPSELKGAVPTTNPITAHFAAVMADLGQVEGQDYTLEALQTPAEMGTLYPEFASTMAKDNTINGSPESTSGSITLGFWCSDRQYDLYWYHPNYLGSVDLVTNKAGRVHQFFMYTAWGEAMYEYTAQTTTGSFDSPYRFNGKELDKETGYSYYGARYYQSKLSMWLSVDPLAHKYPNMSPYNFSGNNPVMLVDPDGREIWIAGEDGATLYTPGMKYEGNDAYIASVVDAYNEAYSGSEKAREVIDGLVDSKSAYHVKASTTKSEYEPGGGISQTFGDSKTFHEKDAGGTIFWNPNGNNVPVQKEGSRINFSTLQKSPMAGLMHETAHAFDQLNGNLPTRDVLFKGLPVAEWQATHTENIIRSQMNMPLRTHYMLNSYNNKRGGQPLLRMNNGEIISNYLWLSQGKYQSYK